MKKISLLENNRDIFILNKVHYNVIIIKNILWSNIVKSENKKDFKTNDNLVVGRNAVIELIKSGREIENILIAKGEREGSVSKIIALAKDKGIVIKNLILLVPMLTIRVLRRMFLPMNTARLTIF